MSIAPSSAMFQFLFAYALVMVTPGSIMLATGSLAALHGIARTLPFILGIGAGTGGVVALLGLASGSLFSALSPMLLQQAGAVVLLCMAAAMIRMPLYPASRSCECRGSRTLVVAGAMTAMSSPFTPAFAASMFAGPWFELRTPAMVFMLALVICLANLTWYFLVATILSRPPARAAILRRQGLFRVAAAGFLCLFAVSSIMNSLEIRPGF
ncbi:LysE family translocator [Rhizobium sp. LCM 4573]|uniref:LysE family translocator n=1 Tax=Rhizobium sp. LCM 4573 TaxID=1848291 RepID=UPI0008DA5BF0|nr:LysE family transporter [Rhizobium sp. LCM 4573]OHV82306.1 hypothetical protein LCM4573_20240 [Rhizobium sp. LCM 4573]